MPDRSLLVTLAVFLGQWAVFTGAGVAAQFWRRRLTGRGSTALEAVLLHVLAPAALGFLAFAAYFLHPLVGRTFSWLVLLAIGASLALVMRARFSAGRAAFAVHGRLLVLPALAGLFYLSTLFVFPLGNVTPTAGQRFLAGMPGDNFIPTIFAERLYSGVSPRKIGGDWLSSDRPPLQTGLALVTLPAWRALDIGFDKACATAGGWFQLLWIPALWIFLRWLGLTEHRAHAATAALVFTGFLLFNSVFVWPKLAAGACLLLAFCTLYATEQALDPRWRGPTVGALAAAGYLAHGGVLFSLLALVPLVLWRRPAAARRFTLRSAAATFAVLILPWLAYQRFYEPPGNRLVKWHIAGAIAPDDRGVVQAFVDNYSAQGWSSTLATRATNLRVIFLGAWPHLLTTRDVEAMAGRRSEEVFHFFRTPAAWILGAGTLPVLGFLLLRRRPAWRDHVRRHGLALAWLGLTLGLWLAVMFFPDGTMVHQGSYAGPLVLLGLVASWPLLVSRRLFAALALLQIGLFILTWLPASPAVATVTPQPFALGCAVVTGGLIALFAATALFPAWTTGPFAFRFALPTTLSPVVFAALALALFLRRPHALLVPQLYAEDGTIFLTQNDLLGLRAVFEPYMGYLHALPRLIAWLASRLLDPAWWPAFYNSVAYALWLFVVVRTFSPRLPLPARLRPWLALTFILGPHTGEILFNITNLQWIVAFLLVQQAVLTPPANVRQRVGDLALVVLLGLTGPFIIALGPLFLWRWWRDVPGRFRLASDSLHLLLVAAGCAAIQAYFILQPGPRFTFPPFAPGQFFAVVGQHLLVWPVAGDHLARATPPLVLGVLGCVPAIALLLWALRPHSRRPLRTALVAAFLVLLAAGVYRSRPDTWNLGNLVFGDRYFFLPRVLLAWLLILEIDTASRPVRWLARAVVLAIAVVHLKGYVLPPEPNYHWARHVEPIRRGVPANIPTLPEGWTMEYRGRPAPR